MDSIINDRMLDKTQKYIQEIMSGDIASAIFKEKLVSYYQSLNPENAHVIHLEISKLHHEDRVNSLWALSCSVWKYSAISFLICGAINLGTHIGSNYYPQNKYIKIVKEWSGIGLVFSAVAFFMGGFAS